jgi:hypothetical protein
LFYQVSFYNGAPYVADSPIFRYIGDISRIEGHKMSPANIENILSRTAQELRKLIDEAYEAGRVDMKRELAAFLADGNTPLIKRTVSLAASSEVRAQAGTVKPAIKALIENANNGIPASDIIEKTGFKENSVRGTLSALKTEGFAERRGELWFPSRKKNPLASASGA